MKRVRCRGCGREIFFAQHAETGSWLPFDCLPSIRGRWIIEDGKARERPKRSADDEFTEWYDKTLSESRIVVSEIREDGWREDIRVITPFDLAAAAWREATRRALLEGFVPHWATCIVASQFRKNRDTLAAFRGHGKEQENGLENSESARGTAADEIVSEGSV